MSTTIREATEDDIFDILILAKEFSKEAPSTHTWNKNKTEAFLNSVLVNDTMVMFVLEVDGEIVGSILGLVIEVYMSHKVQATELAWFITKEYRGKPSSIRLVKAFEKWAIDKGANQIGMGDIEGISNLEHLYTRMGYKKAESIYIKEI